jgi:3-oxoadipate enol-lactonase
MPRQSVNGVELYWELHGPEDGDPLVLNNGVFMTTASWAFQIPEFARCHRVLTYDMRGQGRSDHPESEYSLDLHADDLAALMDALDLGQAHLVGTSYGGELNLVMGARFPERCRTLVIIASVSHSEPPLAAAIARWRAAAIRGDAAAFFRAIAPDVYSDAFLAAHPDWLAQAEERAPAFDLEAAVRLIESFQRFDQRATLSAIRIPTCIVSAERDILKPPASGEYLHAAIANSEFHLVPGAGHAVVLERPAEVNAIVLDFLARHAARAWPGD